MHITVGADPEFFVTKKGTNKPVSAYGLVPGTKKAPYSIKDGAVQVDGMALEFNIEPADSCLDFMRRIRSVKKGILEMVPDFELFESCIAEFGKDYIQEQPDKAKELGCDPDFNAWTEELNEVPDDQAPFRTAAGHVHVGWTKEEDIFDISHSSKAFDLCKQLDFYLGLPSLLFDPEKKRRALYGKAGACRVKPYGVEYRVLSNKWIHSEELTELVYNNTQEALNSLLKGRSLFKEEGDIQGIINSSNVEAARDILNKQGIPYVY